MIIVILILLIIGSVYFYGKYDHECEAKAEMIRDVYRGLLNE